MSPGLAELRKGRWLHLRQQFRDQPALRFLRLARRRLGLLQRKGHLELLHQLHYEAMLVRRIILRRQRLRDPRPLQHPVAILLLRMAQQSVDALRHPLRLEHARVLEPMMIAEVQSDPQPMQRLRQALLLPFLRYSGQRKVPRETLAERRHFDLGRA